MASSTPSANTAQRAPGRPLDDGAIQNSQDSTAEPTKGTADNSALPNGHRTVPRIIDGPQQDAGDDDDPPAPFPPYREPDETGGREDVESHGHNPLHISTQDDSTPLSTADEGATQSESTAGPIAAIAAEPTHETIADPPSPPLQTSEQTSEQAPETVQEAEPEPFVQPTPLSPLASPPAPPPPYWTHSRDGSQGNNTSLDVGRPATAAASTGRTNAETSFFSAPFFRRLDTSSRSQGTASSISSATQRPSTSSTNPSSLYIGSRGTAASTGNVQTSYQGHHRRDTSSSTLDGNVNLITLQDNEAAEDDGYGSSSGWQYNGATPATGAPASSSSALLSPTASALRHPGPPPGNTGSGNTSPLAAPRTTNHSPKNINYNRCWARRVDVTDHVVIGAGNSSTMVAHPRLGAFVVWTIRVQTLEGSSGNPYYANNGNAPRSPNNASSPSSSSSAGHSFCIYKRYSEFDALRRRLLASFPQARGGGALPPLPPKSVLGKFRPDFLEKRRLGLQYFLNCILLNPEFAGSPVLKEFLFS
ncbi:hypothetical protein SPBR_05854 [Sporothrix brasiliensis 5110]|uniref:Endosomal/vacuolar adapter protein YPT35 n=1 Tax=Sporothrix brasiliensis 5110 TaxID=1398154 RepID=A0A0C2F5R2_9PEZI|nr:uncharacterized protein SPBR_05854 [Sporothrix brasiliensis 5110]KIH94234.1 hypothetical protein SPBR_05854 [Sporothrix brasiliensis 5110]